MPPQPLSTEQIAAILAGDAATTRYFIEGYSPFLRGYLRKRLLAVGNSDDVEDVLQEVWCEVLKGHPVLKRFRLDGGRALSTFLCQFVRWRLPAILARRGIGSSEEQMLSNDAGIDIFTDGQDETHRQECREQLRAIIERVSTSWSAEDKRIFEMLFLEQADDEVLMSEFSVLRNTVQQWRSRMRRSLLDMRDEILTERSSSKGKVKN